MGFLDNIGQRPSESRPTASRPSVAENPIRGDAAAPVRPMPAARDSSQPNRIHPLVIWSAVLVVIAAIAAGAWLGLRHSAMFSPDTETKVAADASPEAAQPAPQATQNRGSTRSQPVGRRASRSGPAIAAPVASGETSIEAEVPVIEPVSQAANVTETTTTQVEAVSDPIVAADSGVARRRLRLFERGRRCRRSEAYVARLCPSARRRVTGANEHDRAGRLERRHRRTSKHPLHPSSLGGRAPTESSEDAPVRSRIPRRFPRSLSLRDGCRYESIVNRTDTACSHCRDSRSKIHPTSATSL